MKLVFISGPYRGHASDNIECARKAAIRLWEAGYAVFCPHLNTAHFELDCKCEDEVYLKGDLEILKRCDAIYMLRGWEESVGAVAEREAAIMQGKEIIYE